MKEDRFTPPTGAFTRTVPIRFSHCDPAGIVYFPHYFDMFNGLVEDWYTEQLGVNYANLILGDQHGFPYVHIETDFKLPSRMGERLDLTLLLTRVGRSSIERRHRGTCKRGRAAARAPGYRDDVFGDPPVGGIAQGAAGKV